MQILTPEPGLIFWMTVIFGIVVFILTKYGFPVILKMINERKEFIDSAIQDAKTAHEELAKLKENQELLLAETRKEQSALVAEAKKLRTQILNKAKEEATLEADKIIESARQQILAEKETSLNQLRNEMSTLAVAISEKILRKNLENQASQEDLVHKLINEMDF